MEIGCDNLKGKTFDSSQEAIEFVNNYTKANFHPLRMRNCVTTESYNKKVTEASRLPSHVEYQTLHWECKHFGFHKSRSQGKRLLCKSYAIGCPVKITIVFNRLIWKYVISKCVLTHNHEVSKELHKLYPDQRRPVGELSEEVDKMLAVNMKPSRVVQALQRKGIAVGVKYIYNRKQKLILSGKPASLDDVNNVDWVPTQKMGHDAEGHEPEEVEDVNSRWQNWENFVRRIIVFLQTGTHEEDLTKPEQRAIHKAAKTYYLEGGMLYHQRSGKPLKVVMLEKDHRDVIQFFHVSEYGAHSGINATVDRISSKYFWRGIKQDVVQYISQCCGNQRQDRQKEMAKSLASKLAKPQDDNGGDDATPGATSSVSRKYARMISKHKSPKKSDSSEKPFIKENEGFEKDLEITGVEKQEDAKKTDADLVSTQERHAPEEEITILDEIEGTFVNVARKHLVTSEDNVTVDARALPGREVPPGTSILKNQNRPPVLLSYATGTPSDVMPAASTILKLVTAASKEKSESQNARTQYLSVSSKHKVSAKPEILPKSPISSPEAGVKSPTKVDIEGKLSSKSFRSVAWSLHNIGMRMVRQQVYKDLVDIQELKNEQNRLDDGEKVQLEKLKGYYLDLKQKNRYLVIPGRRCRCGYRVGSRQELELHQEYGHGWDSGRYDCCLCKFTSKAYAMFSSHMVKEHGRKARLQLPLAPFVCPYCPFEHRHNTKKKLLRHIANCERSFQLDNNLITRAIDTDIPIVATPKPTPSKASTDESPGTVTSKNQTSGSTTGPRNQRSLLKVNSCDSTSTLQGAVTSVTASNGGPPSKTQPPVSAATCNYEICEICGGFVKDRASLLSHLKIAHRADVHLMCAKNSTAPLPCKLCSERFWTTDGLELHIELMHANTDTTPAQNPFISVCPLCKRTRLTDVMLHLAQQHRVTLLDMFLVRYCALCLLELHSEKAFEDHMTTRHSALYSCRSALVDSIRSMEQSRQSGSCRPSALLLALVNRNKIPWKFNSARNPIQMFSCPICRCQFGSLDHLTNHFEHVHSYRCSQCEYRCGSAEVLRRHFRTEHGDTDLCPICKIEIPAGVGTVKHFERFHLGRCTVSLKRTSVEELHMQDDGVSCENILCAVVSGVTKSRPSSVSDGSGVESISDDETGESPAAKRQKLDDSGDGFFGMEDLSSC